MPPPVSSADGLEPRRVRTGGRLSGSADHLNPPGEATRVADPSSAEGGDGFDSRRAMEQVEALRARPLPEGCFIAPDPRPVPRTANLVQWQPGMCRNCLKRRGTTGIGCSCGCEVCEGCARKGAAESTEWKIALWCKSAQPRPCSS